MKYPISLGCLVVLFLTGAARGQGNLVVNGGFDTDAASWNVIDVPYIGYVGGFGNPSGSFCLRDSLNLTTVPTVSQQIDGLTPGMSYTVSGQFRSGGKGFAADSFGVAIDGTYLFLASSPADYEWYGYSFPYVASSTSVLLSISAQLNGTGYAYYIDNVAMYPVPEPGVLSLCGVGSLLLWRRIRGRTKRCRQLASAGAV